uniref:Nucleoporin NSP1-like C-terminal domain-containing protein n=1 Tax=Riptortus pedestris TaxID=329032 RepID=R4WD43_RIPPE|nr:conserved hypothetical protein [Riptortus pedestris]
MNPVNSAKPSSTGATPGIFGTQAPPKPTNNLFTTPPASTNVSKPPTTGTPTLFASWPTSGAPSAQSTGFKPSPGTTTTSSLTFKTPTSTMQSKPSSSSTPLTSQGISLGFNSPATTAPSLPTFGLPAASKPTTATSAPVSFGVIKSTTTSAPAPSSPIVTSSIGPSPGSTSSTSSTTTALTTSSLTNKPATSTAPAAQPQSLTFQQLEELILNKWTAELYEQEKAFLNQATQINIWDKIINENAEKLTQLHTTMEKVRKQQTKINDDLEVIFNHQKDLESCLVPMEKEDLLSVLKADPNRKNLYSNAKKIDSQIKSMSENLKETIEHINETSRSHDTEDPVIQVGRILNAHMESLRWIDEHTARMQDYFDSLLKIHDDLRRECDLNKHDVY